MRVGVELVLAALCALRPYPDQGTADERRALLHPVAEAIVAATGGQLQPTAAMVALGYHESAFARYVLEGRCGDGPPGARCDSDRKGRPQARGPWQVHDWCPAWKLPEGSPESLAAEAHCAERMMRRSWELCGRTWLGAFSGYATATRVCSWPRARVRVATMALVERRLRQP